MSKIKVLRGFNLAYGNTIKEFSEGDYLDTTDKLIGEDKVNGLINKGFLEKQSKTESTKKEEPKTSAKEEELEDESDELEDTESTKKEEPKTSAKTTTKKATK